MGDLVMAVVPDGHVLMLGVDVRECPALWCSEAEWQRLRIQHHMMQHRCADYASTCSAHTTGLNSTLQQQCHTRMQHT